MSEYLAVDVGGTQVKGALLDKNGSLVSGGIMEIPSKAKESKETILDNFFCLFESLSEKGQGKIEGMAFSFPGEFDYEQGISLISGLDKYDAIYGVNLKQEFRKMICAKALRDRFICPETLPICFLNDVEAFAMGAAGSGSETAPQKPLHWRSEPEQDLLFWKMERRRLRAHREYREMAGSMTRHFREGELTIGSPKED